MANRNFLSNKMYQMEAYPVLLACNFVVDSTNTNGLGISSLKGGAVRNVFMHTSATPGSANGYLNPNPESGVIMVQLADNYNRYLGGFSGFVSYVDGSSQTSTTAGRASVITALGTATLAQWQAKGLPVGVTPAVGVCFIATASGSIGGSAAVQRPLASGISSIEACGNPNQALALSNSPVNGGSILVFQTLGASNSALTFTGTPHTLAGTVAAPVLTMNSYTPAGTITNGTPDTFAGTPAVLTGTNTAPAFTGESYTPAGTISAEVTSETRTAPLNGSIVTLSFYLSNSSVSVQGQ